MRQLTDAEIFEKFAHAAEAVAAQVSGSSKFQWNYFAEKLREDAGNLALGEAVEKAFHTVS
jgi:hypothetical protein